MKTFLGTVAAVALLTAGIVGFVLWDEAKRSQRLSAEAEAIGFTATETRWYDSGEEREEEGHTLTYAYTVGESVFTRTLENITWYDPARTYKVCYNPEDGDDSKLYRADHVCGS